MAATKQREKKVNRNIKRTTPRTLQQPSLCIQELSPPFLAAALREHWGFSGLYWMNFEWERWLGPPHKTHSIFCGNAMGIVCPQSGWLHCHVQSCVVGCILHMLPCAVLIPPQTHTFPHHFLIILHPTLCTADSPHSAKLTLHILHSLRLHILHSFPAARDMLAA